MGVTGAVNSGQWAVPDVKVNGILAVASPDEEIVATAAFLVIPIALLVKRVGLDDTWFVLILTYMTFSLASTSCGMPKNPWIWSRPPDGHQYG